MKKKNFNDDPYRFYAIVEYGTSRHGETGGFTITHYIVEPVHLFAAICLLSITIALYSYIKRSTKPAKKKECV